MLYIVASTAKTSLQLDQFDFKIASNSSKTKDVPASSGRMQERNISVCSAARLVEFMF